MGDKESFRGMGQLFLTQSQQRQDDEHKNGA